MQDIQLRTTLRIINGNYCTDRYAFLDFKTWGRFVLMVYEICNALGECVYPDTIEQLVYSKLLLDGAYITKIGVSGEKPIT